MGPGVEALRLLRASAGNDDEETGVQQGYVASSVSRGLATPYDPIPQTGMAGGPRIFITDSDTDRVARASTVQLSNAAWVGV